jgi:hypothetical protein
MMLQTLHRCDRPMARMFAAALILSLGAGGVTAAGPQASHQAFTSHETARSGANSPLHAEVAVAGDPIRARIEGFSEPVAKQFYLGCSNAAMRGRLGGAETEACSIGYDVVLKRHFGGDFHALLAWSRSQPRERDGDVVVDGD